MCHRHLVLNLCSACHYITLLIYTTEFLNYLNGLTAIEILPGQQRIRCDSSGKTKDGFVLPSVLQMLFHWAFAQTCMWLWAPNPGQALHWDEPSHSRLCWGYRHPERTGIPSLQGLLQFSCYRWGDWGSDKWDSFLFTQLRREPIQTFKRHDTVSVICSAFPWAWNMLPCTSIFKDSFSSPRRPSGIAPSSDSSLHYRRFQPLVCFLLSRNCLTINLCRLSPSDCELTMAVMLSFVSQVLSQDLTHSSFQVIWRICEGGMGLRGVSVPPGARCNSKFGR